MRYQFVVGLRHKRIQKQLFIGVESPKTSFWEILKIAISLETAVQERVKLEPANDQNTYKLNAKKPQNEFTIPTGQKEQINCSRCGEARHDDNSRCTAFDKICNYCQKIGHFAKVCFKKPKNTGRTGSDFNRHIVSDNDISFDYPVYYLHEVNKIYNKGLTVEIEYRINGKLVNMLMDTGVSVACIDKLTWRDIGSPQLKETKRLNT